MNDARQRHRRDGGESMTDREARYGWVHEAAAAGAQIVTATKRLSRELHKAYDERQLAAGSRAWHTPRIVPWNAWLARLLDDATGSVPFRLDARAAAVVWEQLLAKRLAERVLNMPGFVRQVQQAWQRMHDWRVSQDDLESHAHSEDERLFARVARDYREKLAANEWIDRPQLAGYAAGLLREGRCPVPTRLVCAGFDRVHPAAEELFARLQDAGCPVSPAPSPPRRGPVAVVACADGDAELRSAGSWARRQLQADGRAQVAIVCSTLEQDAARAARLVREGFAPAWQQGSRQHRAAVNVSYGRPLSEYPLIAAALLWLQWTCRPLSSLDLSLLLRAPYAGRGEVDGRCRLELALRRLPDREWSPADAAAALAGRDRGGKSADWLSRVRLLADTPFAGRGWATPVEWAGRADALLEQLGWPGEKPASSQEFQLQNRWRELLNELARLDIVRPRMRAREAVRRLTAMAADTLWQPETGPGRLQLLGALEASGLEFDAIWISGADDETWPPAANPLPLISRVLQRKAGMPDATPADTLAWSRRILGRLAAGGPRVVLSWPRADGEAALAPSPLAADLEAVEAAVPEDPGWHAAALAGRSPPTCDLVDPVPPVRAGETVRGGAYTVQRQATDPFSAFAGSRLGVRELQQIEPGLSPGVRGSIVHAALQQFLSEKPTIADIRAWQGASLDARIEAAAEHALSPLRRHADRLLRRLLTFERQRLETLLRSFLAGECGRQDFVVDSLEEQLNYTAHGVDLLLRIDRIDRLADGSRLVIDYKTGAVKTLLTQDDEPKELQLVVYAAALGEGVGGLLLINLDSRGVDYRGAGGEWDSRAEPWDERLGRWLARVDREIAGIAAGDARVNTALPLADLRPLGVLSRAEELKRGA
jgi:ATP-dependent helicase/nuclease subunit B